ncbi:MAG: M24 family metallopeptidase [Candidatus Thorarchaeota archaeon]
MQFTSRRLDRIHRAMRHEGLDGLIITRPSNVQYFTGYDRPSDEIPMACVVPLDATPVLILAESQANALNHDQIMAQIRTYTRHEFNDWNFPQGSDFWPEIVAAVTDLGITSSNIGLEQNWLSVREFEGLKSYLPEAAFTDFSQVLWRLRQIKDAAELEAIRHAVKVAEIGIRTALEIVDVGKSEIEMSLEIESAMRGAGGQLRGIRAAVLAGEHGRLPFATPGIGRLVNESTVVIDITVSFSGYFAEIARTIQLGTPSGSQREVFAMASSLLDQLEQTIVPGADIGKVATQALASVTAHGSLCDILLPLGNSIGLDLHEPPFIDPSSTSGVREGLVLSLRPVCYTHSVGVVKMADVVFVTAEGIENLTTLSRETL